MRFVLLVGGVFIASALVSSDALGHFYDGNKLIGDLREYEKAERGVSFNGVADGVFIGFVTGVFDTISTTLCISDDITVRQVQAIVAKYLNEHPEQWGRPAYALVTFALRSAFPCR